MAKVPGERRALWNEAFLSPIQAFPTPMCQGRDTKQGHDCHVQGSHGNESEEMSGSPSG